jgi:glycerol-3-phosphate dehydrogenase
MSSADVVIIGGGVNGASVAFNLARFGVRRVTLLERRHLGAGASGKSGSLVRMHYTNEAESRLTWESLKVFRNFASEVGCGLEAPGFVQVVDSAHAEALRANVAMQQRLGIDTRLVSREELREVSPDLRVDDIGAAAYEPRLRLRLSECDDLRLRRRAPAGATIETDCEVLRILTEGDRVAGVETSRGRVTAPVVVAVPGAWAGRLLDSRRRPPSADVSRSGSSRASRKRRTSRASARPASRRGNPGSMHRTRESSGRPSPARPPYFAAAFFAGFFLATFACSAARQRYQEAVVRCGRQRSPYSWSALGEGKARSP